MDKKPIIRFWEPKSRILTTILPLIGVSIQMNALVLVFGMVIPAVAIAVLAVIQYYIIEFFFVRRYIMDVISLHRYVCTNLLAYVLMTAIAMVFIFLCSHILGDTIGPFVFTFLFFPMKLFNYMGINIYLSIFLVGFCTTGFSMLIPLMY